MPKVNLQKPYDEARDQYTRKMQHTCSPDTPSMTQEYIVHVHILEVDAARAYFSTNAKALAAEPKDIEQNLTKLTEELKKHKKEYFDLNQAKTTKTIAKGKAAFLKSYERVTHGKPLCLQSYDLEMLHSDAVDAATKAFGIDRIRGHGPDWDSHYLSDYLIAKTAEARLINTMNNKLIGYELALKYFQEMMDKCIREPKLTTEEFNTEHEKARVKAIEEFASKRNRPDRSKTDILKFKVEQSIMVQYAMLKQINASVTNKSVLQRTIPVYDQHALPASSLWQYCFHHEDLKKNHEDALCRALRAFRSNRACSEGFKDSEKEERDLHYVFMNRYTAMSDINNLANQVAEETGFLEFRYKFNILVNLNGNGWWSMKQDKRRKCYGEAIVVGIDTFYAKRRDRKHHDVDSYYDEMVKRCKGYSQVEL